MSDKKKKPRIKIEFFKGAIGSLICLLVVEFNALFAGLATFSGDRSQLDSFSFIGNLALFGIFFFPIWYWFIYPFIIYSLDEAGIDLGDLIRRLA